MRAAGCQSTINTCVRSRLSIIYQSNTCAWRRLSIIHQSNKCAHSRLSIIHQYLCTQQAVNHPPIPVHAAGCQSTINTCVRSRLSIIYQSNTCAWSRLSIIHQSNKCAHSRLSIIHQYLCVQQAANHPSIPVHAAGCQSAAAVAADFPSRCCLPLALLPKPPVHPDPEPDTPLFKKFPLTPIFFRVCSHSPILLITTPIINFKIGHKHTLRNCTPNKTI